MASPQVSVLQRADPGGLAEALGNLLTFTALQFNVVRNLSDLQIQLLANDLPSRYWHWRIQEFVYVCREAVAGRWGKIYDRLDPPTVYDWCTAYATEEQARAIADAAEKRATDYKAIQPHIDPMPVLYLRRQVEERYRPDQWLNLQRWLHDHFPDRSDLQQVVSDVDAEYTRQKRLEATQLKAQQLKARLMLERFEAGDYTTPGEREFEIIPRLIQLEDAQNTSAEEVATRRF